MKEISLIISVYKNLDALQLILKSIAQQKHAPKIEVIVAEDNNGAQMAVKMKEWQGQFSFPIVHVQQADEGFRKCRILNEAIRQSKGEYLVFMDGDCLLHPMFLYEHNKLKKEGAVTYGRRVMLSPSLSQEIVQKQDLKLIHWFNLIRYACKRLDAALYLPFSKPENRHGFWGHNWGIYAKDLKAVGGFDEAYTQAGIGEDTDIDWRLQQNGMQFQRCKNRLIQYHLYHQENYQDTREVEQIWADKKAQYLASGNRELLMGNL